MSTYRAPRLSVELTDKQQKMLDEMCDHGERIRLIHSLLDGVIAAYERFGKIAVYVVLAGKADILKTVCSFQEGVDEKEE